MRRRRWIVRLPYALALGLALANQLGLYDPSSYVRTHLLATSALGGALLAVVVSQVLRYVARASAVVQQQIRTLAWGALLALALPVCLTIGEALSGGSAPQNAVGYTAFILPLSVAYAVLRRDALAASPVRSRPRF